MIPDWLTVELLLTLIAVLLLGILVALVVLAVKNGKHRIVVDQSLDEALSKVQAAATHTADIAALADLVEQIKLNPEILLRVDEYGATTLAAARIHAMKLLEGDLTHARKVLSRTLRSLSYPSSEHQAAIARDQTLVDNIEEKLLAVVQSRRTDA